jgi:hypothetical protein
MQKSDETLAPVALFVYNRPDVPRRTLTALSENKLANQSMLYIFSDGSKETADPETVGKILTVRRIIREKKWCQTVEIIERDKNWGLAENIINGVGEVIGKHGKVIVLEDDLITAPGFLQYMNDGLRIYAEEKQFFGVTGFRSAGKIPKESSTFFLPIMSSWTWATWLDRWQEVSFDGPELLRKVEAASLKRKMNYNHYPFYEMLKAQVEGKVNSWAIRFYTSMFLQEKLFLYPAYSLVQNIGFGIGATHTKSTDVSASVKIDRQELAISKIPVEPNHFVGRSFIMQPSWLMRKWSGLKRRTRNLTNKLTS